MIERQQRAPNTTSSSGNSKDGGHKEFMTTPTRVPLRAIGTRRVSHIWREKETPETGKERQKETCSISHDDCSNNNHRNSNEKNRRQQEQQQAAATVKRRHLPHRPRRHRRVFPFYDACTSPSPPSRRPSPVHTPQHEQYKLRNICGATSAAAAAAAAAAAPPGGVTPV